MLLLRFIIYYFYCYYYYYNYYTDSFPCLLSYFPITPVWSKHNFPILVQTQLPYTLDLFTPLRIQLTYKEIAAIWI